MKYGEPLYPPKQVKVDTITNEEQYLSEKLKDWRAEYQSKMAKVKPPKKIRFVFYVVAIILFITGGVLSNVLKTDVAKGIGYALLVVSAISGYIGLLMVPRKNYETNPFELKLAKPVSMDVEREGKKSDKFWFTFDFQDNNGSVTFAITESKYTEEEKEKICKSFVNGTVIVATDEHLHAEIIEY